MTDVRETSSRSRSQSSSQNGGDASSSESSLLQRPPRSSRRSPLLPSGQAKLSSALPVPPPTAAPRPLPDPPFAPVASTSRLPEPSYTDPWSSNRSESDHILHGQAQGGPADAYCAPPPLPPRPQSHTGLAKSKSYPHLSHTSSTTFRPHSPTRTPPPTSRMSPSPSRATSSLYALHEPPILLPPGSAKLSQGGWTDDTSRGYDSDGRRSTGLHSSSRGTSREREASDEELEDWTGLELLDDDEVHGSGSDYLRRSLGGNVYPLRSGTDGELAPVQRDDEPLKGAEKGGDSALVRPTGERRLSSKGSRRRLSRVSAGEGTPEEEMGENAWWKSSGSLADLTKTLVAEGGDEGDVTLRPIATRDEVESHSDTDTTEKDAIGEPNTSKGEPTPSPLSSQPISSRSSLPPSLPLPTFDLPTILPLNLHKRPLPTSSDETTLPSTAAPPLAPLDVPGRCSPSPSPPLLPAAAAPPSEPLVIPPRRNRSPSSPLPLLHPRPAPISVAAANDFDTNLDLADAMAISLHHSLLDSVQGRASSPRSPHSPRTSSRGATSRDGLESSASSVYSRTSGLNSPRGDVPLHRPRSRAEQHSRDAAIVPTPVLSSERPPAIVPPAAAPPSALPSLSTSPAILGVATTPMKSPAKRREAKPERGAPVLQQKSLNRPRRVAEAAPPTIPLSSAEPVPQVVVESKLGHQSDPVELGEFVEGSRPMSRPRETTPLSSSDFAVAYGTWTSDPPAMQGSTPTVSADSVVSKPPTPSPPATYSTPSFGTPDPFMSSEAPHDDESSRRLRNLSPSTRLAVRPTSDTPSDESEYHDATMTRNSSGDTHQSGPRLVPTGSAPSTPSIPESAIGDVGGASPAKGDPRARALAFVADLKRAKLAQVDDANPPESTSPPSPIPESIPPPHEVPSIVEVLEAPPAEVPEPPPHDPVRPVPAPPAAVAPSPATLESSPQKALLSPGLSVPPHSPTPTNGSVLSSRAPSYQSLPFYDLEKLSRNRPLPAALRYREVKSLKSSGDRAKLYAQKINALAREAGPAEVWLLHAKGYSSPIQGTVSQSGSPGKSRHSREDVSTASSIAFPMRSGDSYRAKEIPPGTFGPRDMTPTLPYPGVLHLARNPKPASVGKSGSFFSLGRSASTRRSTTPIQRSATSPVQRQSGGVPSSSLGGGVGLGLPISQPVLVQSTSLGRLSGLGGPRPLSVTHQRRSSLTFRGPSPPVVEPSPEAIERLGYILPNATRDALAAALVAAGNDETLAVSIYLSDLQSRR